MSKQLEVVKFRDLIRITDLPRFVPDRDEPTMEVLGEDFSSVDRVYINDELVSNYYVISRNVMWVEIPRSSRRSLRTIEVISGNFTQTIQASKLMYEIGTRPQTISGVLQLVQMFTKWMLQSPGSDIFNPSRGGGLQDLVGRLVSLRKMEHILSAMTRAIWTTSSQIKAAQATAKGLSLDEKLLDAVLLDTDVSEERLEVRARVQVVSMSGEEAVSGLTL